MRLPAHREIQQLSFSVIANDEGHGCGHFCAQCNVHPGAQVLEGHHLGAAELSHDVAEGVHEQRACMAHLPAGLHNLYLPGRGVSVGRHIGVLLAPELYCRDHQVVQHLLRPHCPLQLPAASAMTCQSRSRPEGNVRRHAVLMPFVQQSEMTEVANNDMQNAPVWPPVCCQASR